MAVVAVDVLGLRAGRPCGRAPGLAVYPPRPAAATCTPADRLAGRHGIRGLDRGDHVRLRLVPQVGRLVIERICRHDRALRRLAGVPGCLAGVGLQPRRTLESDPSLAGLRPLPDDAWADA